MSWRVSNCLDYELGWLTGLDIPADAFDEISVVDGDGYVSECERAHRFVEEELVVVLEVVVHFLACQWFRISLSLTPCLNSLVIAVHMEYLLRGMTGDLWSPKHFGVSEFK